MSMFVSFRNEGVWNDKTFHDLYPTDRGRERMSASTLCIKILGHTVMAYEICGLARAGQRKVSLKEGVLGKTSEPNKTIVLRTLC